MPEEDKSFLRLVYRRIGASSLGVPKKPSIRRSEEGKFFHTEPAQEATDPDKLDHLNLILGGNEVRS